MSHDNEFDTLLDHALTEYRQAEPLAGMEERILERIRRQSAPSRRWWYWTGAAAAIAVLLVAVWIGRSNRISRQDSPAPIARQQRRPVAPIAVVPEVAEAKTVKPPSAKLSPHHRKNPETQSAAVDREHKQFPEPAPLNREERALLALAQSRPDVLRQINRADNDQEIAIPPIAITSLAEQDGVQGDNR